MEDNPIDKDLTQLSPMSGWGNKLLVKDLSQPSIISSWGNNPLVKDLVEPSHISGWVDPLLNLSQGFHITKSCLSLRGYTCQQITRMLHN